MAEHRYSYLQQGDAVVGVAAQSDTQAINLTEAEAIAIGKAFSNWLIYRIGKNPAAMQVCVGVDTRATSRELAIGILKGLHAFGTVAYYAGFATSPAMHMSVALPYWEYDGAVLVTAGDQGDNLNGFKFFIADGCLNEDEVADILYHASRAYLSHEEYDNYPTAIMPMYATMVRSKLNGAKGIKVHVDTSNASGEFFAKSIIEPSELVLAEADDYDIAITINMDGTKCIAALPDGTKVTDVEVPSLTGSGSDKVSDGMLAAVGAILSIGK